MKQKAKSKRVYYMPYRQLLERKHALSFDILTSEITQDLLSKNIKSERVLVIVSEKHQFFAAAICDWPDRRTILNPITGNETEVTISRTKGVFLDEEGEPAEPQLEVHPIQ